VADQDRGSDDPQLAMIARHALHDEELIAVFASDDVEDKADVDRARSLVARCTACNDLHRELRAIRAATRASATAAQRAETHPAPRDFRLTAEDAARLRPGSPVIRLADRHGWRTRLDRGVAAFGRPMGAALATFGIAGLLVGSLTLGGTPVAEMSGGATSSSAPAGVDAAATPPTPTVFRASHGPLATAKGGGVNAGQPGDGTANEETAGPTSPWSVLLVGGSIVLVVVGIVLFAASRRNPGSISTQRGN
jgi:hypothetical protein